MSRTREIKLNCNTAGADLLRQCFGYFRSRSVTAMFGVLQEPICYGAVCGTAGADLVTVMFGVLQEPICCGSVWVTSGADLLRRCLGYCRSRSVTAVFGVLHEPSWYGNVLCASGADLLRRCLRYFRSRSVTPMCGLLQEPICYGNVSGTSGADLLRHRLWYCSSGCYGNVWCTSGAVLLRRCLGVLQELVCYGSVWAYLPTSSGSPDAERCFLFLVLGITARRPQRFRRTHGLQRTGARIAPSPFLRPASLALLLPVVPPRPLLLSSLHAHTALHSNSDGPAPALPSGCRSRARRPEGGG